MTMAPVKMKYGLLWYDADKKRPARDKIDEAVERYSEKFGTLPDTCYVHPNSPAEHPQLRVLPSPLVLPNHFLVGVEHAAISPQPSASSNQPSGERAAAKRAATRKAEAKPAAAAAPAPAARTVQKVNSRAKKTPVAAGAAPSRSR